MFYLTSNLAIQPEQIKENVFKLFCPFDITIRNQTIRRINFDINLELLENKITELYPDSELLSKGLISAPKIIYESGPLFIEIANFFENPRQEDIFRQLIPSISLRRKDEIAILFIY